LEAYKIESYYLQVMGADLFTVVCLPREGSGFPTVIFRSPYVDSYEDSDDQSAAEAVMNSSISWLSKGYAVVSQHCRGCGKSTGDCIPYIYEREDGLHLQEWVRHQPFYNGEIYLVGSSYTASVHFVTSPFSKDIKGAVLQVQDSERYNCNYRNGFYKIGLHGGWYARMYKKKSLQAKKYASENFQMLPLIDFSSTVFGEKAEDFDEILLHPNHENDFWKTRYGGGEAHNAIKYANIPILLVTGFYDIYTGGVFDMWNAMEQTTREKCALLVHPYDHMGQPDNQPVRFENGSLTDVFGEYTVQWIEYIRGKAVAPAFPGKVTYYKLFDQAWCTDDFAQPDKKIEFTLGEGEQKYIYDPKDPASFKGGLSTNFGGSAWQDPPYQRPDILTYFTPAFEKDTFLKGKMQGELTVKSNCEDTCFYMRISLVKTKGDYGLRDDIQQISNFCHAYKPGEEVRLHFSFDEHAFVIRKGEKIRVDISSSALPHYVPHTNRKGLYALQTTAKIAENTIVSHKSKLIIFVTE